MARKKASGNKVEVGDISEISGEVSIAGGNIYKGFTAEQVSVLIQQITTTFEPKKIDAGRSPYKGLDVFEEEDAELFFGRERIVADLVTRVKESRTVFVTGPSGSGKSSLVRAGLIPTLKNGAIKNSQQWLYTTIKPGRDPFEALAIAFSRLKSPELGDYFQQNVSNPDVLHKCTEAVLSERSDQRLVLFIDQFEEVFTQLNTNKVEIFIEMLARAVTAENERVIIMFAMRSDFVSNCATNPKLNTLLNQQFVQIGAMQPNEIVSAIAQPALKMGLHIDPNLIAQIINDMQGEPGTLPLMQFALKDLFDSQQMAGGTIALTLKDYLQRGGIHKALERHANNSFAELDQREQEMARSIFSRLIEIGRGTQDTRRIVLFDELIVVGANVEDVKVVVGKLADARLITTDEGDGKDTVTISHEKLIDAWPWLKKLVDENREAIALQNDVAEDANEWEEHNRDSSYLYTGGRLANVSEQNKKQKLLLSQLAQDFLQAGRARQNSLRVVLTSIITLTLIASLIASIVFQNQAKVNIEIANTAQFANTQIISQKGTAQAIAITAQANADEAQKQSHIALARQLAAQAQSIFATRNHQETTAALLAVQSLQLFPSIEAAQILQNNTLANTMTSMIHSDTVITLAFSQDGRYVISGGWDNTARVWEASTGIELSRMTYAGVVVSVAFSPDDKYVISGGCDTHNSFGCTNKASARVWEAFTGKEISRTTYEGGINSVAFSPDGKLVASGGCDQENKNGRCTNGSVRVWDAFTGKEISRMNYVDDVTSVAFSPDGRRVVSGGCDQVDKNGECIGGSARVWEVISGRELARMAYGGSTDSVTFSQDGRYVASLGCDKVDTDSHCMQNSARVWEALTGREITRITNTWSMALSTDGKYLVTGGTDNTVHVWEILTGNEIAHMTHDSSVLSVDISPDGRYVVSGSNDGTARVWEVLTGSEIARITYDHPVWTVLFSPDGKYVASGGCEKYDSLHNCIKSTARVWKAAVSNEVSRMIHDDRVTSMAFSSNSKYIISGSYDGTARVWETATGQEIARMTHNNWITTVAFSSDGEYVASGSCEEVGKNITCIKNGGVRVWEIATGKEVSHSIHAGVVDSVTFSPDGKYVASGGFDDTIQIWEALTGKTIVHLTHPDGVAALAFSSDGKYLVSAGNDGTARVWEVLTGHEISRMTHDKQVTSIAISPDNRYLVSGSYDDTARVWEVSTGNEIARMTHKDVVTSVSFSPDGKNVVSGSYDNTARVWEALTGKEIARMTHGRSVTSVAFSPDGKYVISGSWDNTARVWEASTGNEIARMTHTNSVETVAFSPDGKYAASGSDDNTVRVWIWQTSELITNACGRLLRNLTWAEWNQYIGNALPYHAVCPNLPLEPIATPVP